MKHLLHTGFNGGGSSGNDYNGGARGGGASNIRLNCCTINSASNGAYPGGQYVNVCNNTYSPNRQGKQTAVGTYRTLRAQLDAHQPALLDKVEMQILNSEEEEVVVNTTVVGEGVILLARVVRAIAMLLGLVVIRLTPLLRLWQMD